MIWVVLIGVLLPSTQGAPPSPAAMRADVNRLVRAAERSTGTWPSQPPPALPDVAGVARHGRAVVPLLMDLLSADPGAERDPRRWRVQQQAALALARIYSESNHCGRTYCDGDRPERIARVKEGWRRVIAFDDEMRALSLRGLLDRFTQEKVFWRQLEVGKALAAAGDRRVVGELEAGLTDDDRHRRGNVAFVLGWLGDRRGFDTIAAILDDRSVRSPGQGGEDRTGKWSLQRQIRQDRYYAAHLLGDLKDPRGVDLLIPLLNDADVGDIVPWSLGQVRDRRAIGPLIAQLERDDPSRRVLAIHALETLNAREALPRLREMLQDQRTSKFAGLTTVAEAARRAIEVIADSR